MNSSSPKQKLLPYLGSKTKLFQGLSFPKFLVKCSDYLSQQKLQNISTRTISSKACLIPSENNTTNPQITIEQETSRSRSTEAIRTNTNLLTLPPLEIEQTVHSDNENNSPRNVQEESEVTGIVQTEPNNPIESLIAKKRVKIIKVKGTNVAPYVSKATPKFIKAIKSFKLEPGFTPRMFKAGSVPNAQNADKFFDFSGTAAKKDDLTRTFYNIPSQSRAKLPLLIIHFEGIIGSCFIQMKRGGSYSETGQGEGKMMMFGNRDYFVKRDARNELKSLAKMFLIAVVMPNSNEKSKKMMRMFINRKYPFDACYYKTKEQDSITANDISGFVLDYETIVKDFQAVAKKKNVLILATIDISTQVIRRDLLGEELYQRPMYNKSSLLSFFPKSNIDAENLKIVCLPNFLLEEKYESHIKLAKSSFSTVSKLILQSFKNFETSETTTATEVPTTEPLGDEEVNEKKEIQTQEDVQDYIETESGGTDVESGDKLVLLNFTEFIEDLEKTRQLNIHRRKFEKIKEKSNLVKEPSIVVIGDTAPIRQKLTNEMIENMPLLARENNFNMTKMTIVSTVANLVMNNASLFKNKFNSSSKHQVAITNITEHLNAHNEVGDEIDHEVSSIELIKQMALKIKVFLDY